MTAATVQSNKIVLNEVKDNSVLLEPSYRKKKHKLFGQPDIFRQWHIIQHLKTHEKTWRNLKYTLLNERSQSKMPTYCIIPTI